MLMLLMAVVMGIGVSMIILQQPFLSSHDVSYGLFGFFLMPGQFLSIAGALLAYRIVLAIGVSRVVALMPLVVMGTAAGLGAVDHVAAFAFYPPTTLMFAMSFVVMADYLNRRIPSATRATVLSIQNMLFSLIVGVTEILLTVIGDWRGLPTAYWTAAVLLAVLGAPLLALWLREHRRETLAGEAPTESAQTDPEAEPEPAQPP
ncbi:MAG: MFS transporter [Dehalococcoidia bacterium]|nr:MFS transporter [Dehalococcoidia bacterium]